MELIKYIPHFLRDVEEYKEISKIGTIELNKLNENADFVFRNQFVLSADNWGLQQWESKIETFIGENDDLEARRKKLLVMIFENRPYTLKSLRTLLDATFGAEAFEVTLDQFTLTVLIRQAFELDVDLLNEILKRILPANINFTVIYMGKSHFKYKSEGYTHESMSAYTHAELKE